jgi:hypothetical protein
VQFPVSVDVVISVLTGLAAVIMVWTRLRLGRARGRSSRSNSVSALLTIYATCAALAVLGWILFLVFPEDSVAGDPLVGIVGLFFWWLGSLIGLRLVTRRPARGKHAAATETPAYGSLLLAHLVLIGVVSYFTYAYTTRMV